MPILLKADIPQEVPFVPLSPVTMPSDWHYAIPDSMAETTPTPSDICDFEFRARPGQVGTLDVNVAVPAGRPGVWILPYVETDTNRWSLTETLATSAGVAIASAFPEFPSGTTEARLGFELREPAAGAILGVNLYTDPRCTTTSLLTTRNGWTLSTETAGFDLPMQTGLRTYGRVQAASSSSGTGRGINVYQATDGTTPTADVGIDVSGLIGETVTISGYVYSTKTGTMQASARCFSGTTWTAAATTGTGSTITASTWTRYSVSITIPAGADLLCASFIMTSSVSWVTGDQIRLSAVMIEHSASLNGYFDGETADTGSEGYFWDGATNASSSTRYNLTGGATQPARSLIVSGLIVTVEAEAEEIVGAALTRPLRRSVYDALNEAAPQIAVGTPGLLAGTITYLCSTLADALAMDGVYQFPGLITLETGTDEALNGFKHMAVDQLRLTAERTVNGRPSKWMVQAEVREIVE